MLAIASNQMKHLESQINIFIYDPIAPDPKGIINQGHGNQAARAIQVTQDDALDTKALLELLKAVIANNRAGVGASSSNNPY